MKQVFQIQGRKLPLRIAFLSCLPCACVGSGSSMACIQFQIFPGIVSISWAIFDHSKPLT